MAGEDSRISSKKMNEKIIERERRRCKLGFWNSKKDPYARRRTRYGCVDGKFSLPGKDYNPPTALKREEESKKLNWWQKLWLKIKKTFLKIFGTKH